MRMGRASTVYSLYTRSRRNPHDRHFAGAGDDPHMALKRLIERRIAGIEQQPAGFQASELARPCQDDEPVASGRRMALAPIG